MLKLPVCQKKIAISTTSATHSGIRTVTKGVGLWITAVPMDIRIGETSDTCVADWKDNRSWWLLWSYEFHSTHDSFRKPSNRIDGAHLDHFGQLPHRLRTASATFQLDERSAQSYRHSVRYLRCSSNGVWVAVQRKFDARGQEESGSGTASRPHTSGNGILIARIPNTHGCSVLLSPAEMESSRYCCTHVLSRA
jgi:hypothetical protein